MDVWTETIAKKSFLGVTIHFFEGIETINTVLSPYVLTGRDRRVTRIVNSDPNSECSFLASFWPKGERDERFACAGVTRRPKDGARPVALAPLSFHLALAFARQE